MLLALAIGVGALLLLACVPLEVDLRVERDAELVVRSEVAWLFGLVRFRGHPREAPQRPEKETSPSGPGGRACMRLLGADVRSKVMRLGRDLWRVLRPRDLRLRARIGLDDPADTGRLWAFLWPLGALPGLGGVHLDPSFDRACFEFRGSARLHFAPARLLMPVGRFLASPAVLRALLAR